MNINDHVNTSDLKERLDDDFEFFKELADIFLTDSVNLMDDIRQAIDTQDGPMLGKKAHTIKGAVSNFSSTGAYDAAYALEKIGKNEEFDKAEAGYAVLSKEIENLKEALITLMKQDSFD